MDPAQKNDKSMLQAQGHAMGVMLGQMFNGLMDQGMTRPEAMAVVVTYVGGLAASQAKDAKSLEPKPPSDDEA